ncbi:hypothetical protein AHAS_Ahas01G0187200 [Arachis hypogaea]
MNPMTIILVSQQEDAKARKKKTERKETCVAATPQEIPTDQNGVAKHLFAAITRFVEHDPVFKNRPIYITGESYAGKYVPDIGYYILKENLHLRGSKRVNLTGLAIGDGLLTLLYKWLHMLLMLIILV